LGSIDRKLVERLHRKAGAERWSVPLTVFASALERSAAKALPDRAPSAADLERYLTSIHLEDVALACAGAEGHDAAWEHFILEYRPTLYRAADAIDPTGGARELADSLYADLYGLKEDSGERRSLFRYFHGRSSLATWLRSVLSQRHVDRIRAHRRIEPLPDEESSATIASRDEPPDTDRPRLAARLQAALAAAVAALDPRDRLRLGCYYGQEMTLAAIGRMLGEHEATVSRQLSRVRRAIRHDVERRLRDDHHLSDPEVAQCFSDAAGDPGTIDVGALLGSAPRKKVRSDRSTTEGMP
jgi:RNA polymerase sigma-70 factor (ECF subfamily)